MEFVQQIKSVFFHLKLLLSLVFFLIELTIRGSIVALRQRRSLLVSTTFLLLAGLILLVKIYNFQVGTAVVSNSPGIENIQLLQEKFLTRSEIQNELEAQLEVLEQQPTHFETLLNVSFLYESLGNEELANQYLLKAREINPNSPLLF